MRRPTSLLPKTYFPRHSQNRMESEGDLRRARVELSSEKANNLYYLLKNRYEWMNKFIKDENTVVEIGAGAGFSQRFIGSKVIATELWPYPWVDACVDAMNLPFGRETIDVVICSNVLHHFASPIKFLVDLNGCLKPSGYVLLLEPNPSLLLLLALRVMRHEGWSFEIEVFDTTALANDPADPWSGNNAISDLMFRDRRLFEERAPGFEIVHDSFSECLMFPLSGGVTAKTRTLQLPMKVLKIIDAIDRKLCRLSPKIFAMGRSVVLRKRSL
jgi:SAM-dependent methyltransferase